MSSTGPARIAGEGWIVLLGGGEFSFGETEEVDRAWLAKVAEGPRPIGFVPAASGSTEYGGHFAAYLKESFERTVDTIPIYRRRDAKRGKNGERIRASAAIYLGGGVAEFVIDTFDHAPALEALTELVVRGGTLAAMAAAAQALGQTTRSLKGKELIPGLGFLPGGAVETNFDPGHDHRLRQLLGHSDVRWGVGLPAGSALLLGPDGERELVGEAFFLDAADADLLELEES